MAIVIARGSVFVQGGEAWAIGAKPEMLVTVRADVDVLLQWISTNFLQQLQQLMPFLSSQVVWPLSGFGITHR